MIYQESKRVRRVVGRLEEGEECVQQLTDFCIEHDIRAAEVRAVGRLGAVEVVRFDPDADEYRPVFEGRGDFDLLSLQGNVATMGDEIVVRLQAVLSADGPVSPQLVTGQLRSGRAVEFEFVLEVYDDLELERRLDAQTGLLELNKIRKLTSQQDDEEAPAIEGQSMSWDDAAEASEQSTTASGEAQQERQAEAEGETESSTEDIYGDIELDEPFLEAGDILDHPKLGRCHVMKVEDDKYAHIRLPRGKIRKLSLSVVDLSFKNEENGRKVFEAQVSK